MGLEEESELGFATKTYIYMNNVEGQTIKKTILANPGTYHPMLFLEINLPS